MANFKRGDLVKTVTPSAAVAAAHRIAAAFAAADQYWYAFNDQSVGLVTKADADQIWVRWCGSKSDQNIHKYYNKAKYFKLVNRNDQF